MPEMYTIRAIPGKGQGIVANKEIKAGTRILTDELLFSITGSTIDEGIEERISESLNRLPPEQQKQFETLQCPTDPTSRTPLVNRFAANCYVMQTVDGMRTAALGIFLIAARVNHACCPNASQSWNGNLRRITIHAMVDISAGEEITISYDHAVGSFASRQYLFQNHYGFRCNCTICDLDTTAGRHSDRRRKRMETLYIEVGKRSECDKHDDEEELEMVLEFLRLAEDEHVDGILLSLLYGSARKCYEDGGYLGQALKYAEMEVETETRILGEDHEFTIESMGVVKELKARVARWVQLDA